MKCAVRTYKGTACKNGVATGCFIIKGGYRYDLCTFHFRRRDNIMNTDLMVSRRTKFTPVDPRITGTTKEKTMQDELFPQSTGTHEVISDLRVQINEINRKAQEKMNKNPDRVQLGVRRVFQETVNTIYVDSEVAIFQGSLEEFKVKCYEYLDAEPNLYGFAARLSNRNLIVTRNKAVFTDKKIKPARIERYRTR